MKTALLFFILLVFFSLPTVSQTEHLERAAIAPLKESRLFIGGALAPGYSTILPYRNTVFHPTLQLGLQFRYDFRNNLGLTTGIALSREGLAFKSGDEKKVQNLDYLRVPLLVLYRFNCGIKDLCPEAGIGAAGGVLFRERDQQIFSMYDAGIQTQVGFRYRLLRGLHLHVCVQHYRGLTDLLPTNVINDNNQSTRLQISILAGL